MAAGLRGFDMLAGADLAKLGPFCNGSISEVLAPKQLTILPQCKSAEILPRKTLFSGVAKGAEMRSPSNREIAGRSQEYGC